MKYSVRPSQPLPSESVLLKPIIHSLKLRQIISDFHNCYYLKCYYLFGHQPHTLTLKKKPIPQPGIYQSSEEICRNFVKKTIP